MCSVPPETVAVPPVLAYVLAERGQLLDQDRGVW